jgi:hypothetical protein
MSGKRLEPNDVVEPVPTTTPESLTPLPTPKGRDGEPKFGSAVIPPPCVQENARVAVKLPVTDRPVANVPLGEMLKPCEFESPARRPRSTML